MTVKMIGAILVLSACGWIGFARAAAFRRDIKTLRQLIMALEYIKNELQYRMPPLPELYSGASHKCSGVIAAVLQALERELDKQHCPEAGRCMELVLEQMPELPAAARHNLQQMALSLGCFDISGQLSGLEATLAQCRQDLDCLNFHREERIKHDQTLGLCAGAAIVILLI